MHDMKPNKAPANNLTTKIINPHDGVHRFFFGGTSVQGAFVLSYAHTDQHIVDYHSKSMS